MTHAEQFLRRHPDVEAVEFVICDPCGILRGKWGPASTLGKAYGEGVNFPLSLHGLDAWGREVPATGLHIESGDRDGVCRAFAPPRITPWAKRRTATVPLVMHEADGRPFAGDPRQALVDLMARCEASGYRPVAAFELEFHLLKPGSVPPEPVGQGAASGDVAWQAMYEHDRLGDLAPLWEAIRAAADAFEVPIDTIVNEAGPGQFEINLAHGPALEAADDAVMLRHIVRECARSHGYTATFMAKPFAEEAGNGCHVHMSLLGLDGQNAFGRDRALLDAAIAGTLEHMPASMLGFVNSWNGFRRFRPGSYAPTRGVWGENNRSVAIRVPVSGSKDARFEHRLSGADACPYVVLALVLAAALDGVERALAPPAPVEGNAYDGAGETLSADPWAALASHAGSHFVRAALGETLARNVHAILAQEFDALSRAIPPFEHETYL